MAHYNWEVDYLEKHNFKEPFKGCTSGKETESITTGKTSWGITPNN